MTIRVLIADDQALVRAGIAMVLEGEPDVVVIGEAANGAVAVERARRAQPDVVLMDVRMPGVDGIAATRRITSDGFSANDACPVQVLVLTTYHLEEVVRDALRAGASGFLSKDAAPGDLLAALRTVAGGGAWLDPAVAKTLVREFASWPEPPPAPEELDLLTVREVEVLVLVARGLSNAEIAAHLVIGTATVKTHVSRILMKLGLRDRVQAVVAAYRTGLVRPDAPGGQGGSGPPGASPV